MYGRVMYVEITPPQRLVYKQQFLDDKGNISRHPGAPTWPETMLTTVRFFEEGPGQSRVSVTWEPFGDAKPDEVAAFGAIGDSFSYSLSGLVVGQVPEPASILLLSAGLGGLLAIRRRTSKARRN